MNTPLVSITTTTPSMKITPTQATSSGMTSTTHKRKGTSNRKVKKTSPIAKPTTQKSTASNASATQKKRGKDAQQSTHESRPHSGRPPSPHGVGHFARTLLVTTLSYDAIIARIRTKFPDAKTSVQCLRWYVTKMREENMDVPNRPRKLRTDRPTTDPT